MSAETELHQLIVKELERLNSAVLDLARRIDNGLSTRISAMEIQDAAQRVASVTNSERITKLENANIWLWRTLITTVLGVLASWIIFILTKAP